MKKEMFFEEAKRLIDDLRKDGKENIKMEVLSRKVDREGLIVPDKVLIEY